MCVYQYEGICIKKAFCRAISVFNKHKMSTSVQMELIPKNRPAHNPFNLVCLERALCRTWWNSIIFSGFPISKRDRAKKGWSSNCAFHAIIIVINLLFIFSYLYLPLSSPESLPSLTKLLLTLLFLLSSETQQWRDIVLNLKPRLFSIKIRTFCRII